MSDSGYRSLFISEVKENIVEIFESLKIIEEKGVARDDVLYDIFRRFHTIKGMSNTMGQKGMGEIAHLLEEILEYVRKNPDSLFSFKEVIMKGINALSIEIDNYENGIQFGSDAVILDLSYISQGIKEKLQPQLDINIDQRYLDKRELNNLYETIFEVKEGCRTPSVKAFMLIREISSKINVIYSEPTLEMLKQGVKASQVKIYTQVKPDIEVLNSIIDKIQELRLVRSDIYRYKEEQKKIPLIKYIRIPFERVEELTSSLDELLLLWNKYKYSLKEENQTPMIGRLEYGFKKVINYAERLRTVPASSITPKLIAMAQSTARSLNKDVKLVVQNENIEIDKSIIDRLEEPLMHIIRNAIYHGIEPLGERIKFGKPSTGIIELNFREEEEFISISIRDDGRGMDREKILKTAQEKGLVNRDEILDDNDILDLVFIPGFSTLQEADMTSGRGFGMDIVRNVIWQLGGDITILSRLGEGTEIILKIPYQFASKKVVVGEIKGFRYAFAVSGVRYILRKNDIKISEDKNTIIKNNNERIRLLNGKYKNAGLFIVCSNGKDLAAVGMDDIIFIGDARLYKVPYILKSGKFINGMVVINGICPVPIISIEYLIDERNL